MSNNVQVIVAFFLGIAFYAFYDYLKCEWAVKAERKKRKYPTATVKKQTNFS